MKVKICIIAMLMLISSICFAGMDVSSIGSITMNQKDSDPYYIEELCVNGLAYTVITQYAQTANGYLPVGVAMTQMMTNNRFTGIPMVIKCHRKK
jgi:hypothetical protein